MSEQQNVVQQVGRWVGRIAAAFGGAIAAFSIGATGLVLVLSSGVLIHQSLNRGLGLNLKLGDVFAVIERIVGFMATKRAPAAA